MLTANFSVEELECRCSDPLCSGKGVEALDMDSVRRLQALRDCLGRPLSLSSGARCLEHNEKEGGKPNSRHRADKRLGLRCHAWDIRATTGKERFEIVAGALKLGFTGIGVAKGFVHVDTRDGPPAVWCYA